MSDRSASVLVDNEGNPYSDSNPLPTSSSGSSGATASATTYPSMSTTAAEIWASASGAKFRKIYNPTSVTLYVIYGSGALTGSSDAAISILAGQVWEMPSPGGLIEWTGQVRGILASGSGTVNATQGT